MLYEVITHRHLAEIAVEPHQVATGLVGEDERLAIALQVLVFSRADPQLTPNTVSGGHQGAMRCLFRSQIRRINLRYPMPPEKSGA